MASGASWRSGRSPADLVKNLLRRRKRMEEMQSTAAGQAALVIESELKKRVFVAKRVSRQDSGQPKDISPGNKVPYESRTRTTPTEGIVRVRLVAFWSKVRVKGSELAGAILRAYSSSGRPDELFRKGLWVKAKGAARNAARHFVEFARHGRLQSWAMRADKGFQFARHAVRIRDVKILERLQMGAALKASQDRIRKIWERAFKDGMQQ